MVATGAAVFVTAAPAAAHPLHVANGPLSWMDVIGRSALGAVLLWATLPLAGLLLASLWAPRGPRLESPVWDGLLGLGLVIGVALLRGGRGLGVLAFALILVHLLAAAVWLGGLLELIVRRQDRWIAVRRFGAVGLGSVVVLVVTGVLNVRVHTGGRPLAGDYEHVLGLKLLLVVGAVGLAAVAHARVRRQASVPSRRLIGGEAGLLAIVVGVAAVLTALPAAASATPAVRVARTHGRVVVRTGTRSFSAAGGDAEECASRAAGVFVAGGDRRFVRCSPAAPEAQRLGAAFARFLAARQATSVVVVADDSPRSSAMTGAFLGVARSAGIATEVVRSASDVRSWADAAVVTSGWSTAEATIAAIDTSETPPVRGAFLAPWLLSSAVTGGPGRVQVAVGLPFDPSSSTAAAYLNDLARHARGATASATGLEGWLAARGTAAQSSTAIQFFTPANIAFLPPSVDAGHDHGGGASWVPGGGRLAAVSDLVRLDG